MVLPIGVVDQRSRSSLQIVYPKSRVMARMPASHSRTVGLLLGLLLSQGA